MLVFIAFVFGAAAFSQVEGDASGADGWRPLKTKPRVIPLLVVVLPPETVAAGAICAAAPFSVSMLESGVATGALFFFARADISTLPIPHLLASVHPLVVVREEEEEGEQQPALPKHKHFCLKVKPFSF